VSRAPAPLEDAWGRRTLDGLERKNVWVLGAVSALAWWLYSGEAAANVLGAGALGALNLRALRRTVEAFLGGRRDASRGFAIASGIRFFIFLNLLIAVFIFLPVNLPAFAAGLSTVVGAAFAEAIHQAWRPIEDDPAPS
jgi:ATP synthase I chain